MGKQQSANETAAKAVTTAMQVLPVTTSSHSTFGRNFTLRYLVSHKVALCLLLSRSIKLWNAVHIMSIIGAIT